MLQEADLAGAVHQVLLAAFAVGAVFGAIAQRTHFCTMGALADLFVIGDDTRLRMWALAIAVATLGFTTMALLGWVDARATVYARPQLIWLSNLSGGLLFGVGMVLASGCGGKTLVRVGGGNLKSLVVFCVLGLASYATLRGLTAVWRVASVDQIALTLPTAQDLPSLLAHGSGIARQTLVGLVGGGIGIALLAWALGRPPGRSAETLLGGVGIGAAVVALWWVSGRLGFVAEHPLTLEPTFLATNTRSLESFTFVAPIAYLLDWVILYSDANKLLTLGITSVAGVIAGSAVAAVAGGTFRWEGFAGTEDTANHMVGAVLMGVGGVTAFGCTVGQGLTGVSTLSLGSYLAVAGIVGGAWLALRYQSWRVERQATG